MRMVNLNLGGLGGCAVPVSCIGLGCMSFTGFFGPTDEATSHKCLDAALDAGINFFDTANIYGMGLSERILGGWKKSRNDGIIIASKVGISREPGRSKNNDPAHIREELEASLQKLQRDHIDLYYLHRRDDSVPLADVIGTFTRLMEEGKIGGYGLSEIAPYTLRLAHAIHPCSAVQNEYSLWTRQPELGLVQTCRELGIAFVPFSPLGRGVFSATFPDPAQMEEGDIRRDMPRFLPQYYPHNMAAIEGFKAYAAKRGVAVAALAVAWLLHRGENMIPIPGTRTAEHLAEWAGADAVTLTPEDMAEIESILPVGFAYGDRYPDNRALGVERYC